MQRFGLAAARREVRHPESSSTTNVYYLSAPQWQLTAGQSWLHSLVGGAVLSAPPQPLALALLYLEKAKGNQLYPEKHFVSYFVCFLSNNTSEKCPDTGTLYTGSKRCSHLCNCVPLQQLNNNLPRAKCS
ncbi:unnamed protein product [Ixodes pacificus]